MAIFNGTSGPDSLSGTNSDDQMFGRAGDDMLFGNDGNDLLEGGEGADRLDGGIGNDRYYLDNVLDRVIEASGGGNDIILSAVSYVLADGVFVESLATTDNAGTASINLTGNSLANSMSGNAGANILNGGAGADVMQGFGGNDRYYVDNALDRVIEVSGGGTDIVLASVSYVLAESAFVESLATTNLAGTGAINLTGNSLANNMSGNAGANLLNGGGGNDAIQALGGNDILNGGAGADAMDGGAGDDRFYIDNAADRVIEASGGGNDILLASVSYVLAESAFVESLATTDNAGTAAINLTGNSLANIMSGNAGANILNGGGGIDIMQGFGGNDRYYVDNALDRVIEASSGGADIVLASVDYVLAESAFVESLATTNNAGTGAINLTGNSLDNIMSGNAGANLLDGGAGKDTMQGLGGNDVYLVDNALDRVIEAASGGSDEIRTALASYSLAAIAEVEKLTGLSNSGQTLTGNALDNVVTGANGNDILNGGAGADTMVGGLGNDTYYVDNALDQITEALDAGSDALLTSVSYVLANGSSVESLSAIDAAATTAINLTGNDRSNSLYGNAGDNVLNGGVGGDRMEGFGGNDTYYIDNAPSDQVIEVAGGGNDTIYVRVSYVLPETVNVETLIAWDTATSPVQLTGNSLNNTLLGNSWGNILNGGAGADVLQGFGGNDTFQFSAALGAGNVDQIVDFTIGEDKIHLIGPMIAATLANGGLRAGTLVIGTAALDADDYLIYNNATGALLYDRDGAGGVAAVQFATLSTGLGLTVADFIIGSQVGGANNAPVISSAATASVAENSSASTIVYQTTASDSNSNRITYSLSGADAGLLSIDGNTGAVRLLAPADFETKSSYSFNVIASDSAVSTVKAVTLTITDVNENVPSTPIINETAGTNDTVATAQTIDPGTFVIATNPNLPNDDYPSATVVGGINALGDTDFYSITLQAGQQLILDVDGTTTLDSFLTLYGPGGVKIGSNDDLVSPDAGSGSQFGHNTDSQILYRAATSGTYYFSIESFNDANGPTSQGDYKINVSINDSHPTPQQIMAEDVDALISGTSWNHPNLTYGFPTLASQYPSSFDEVSSSGPSDPTPTFEAFNATQQAATRQLLQLVANVTNLTFTENTAVGPYTQDGAAAEADLRYAESDEADVAYAYYPNNAGPSDVGGSAWFNHDDFNDPKRGNYAWMGILHETGHALGLKHGHEFPLAISADHDSVEYSVMTYRSYPGGSAETGYTNETYGYPQTLMMLDIAALQKIYGAANYGFNSTDSVYTWSATTGETSINGVGQGQVGTGVGSSNRVFLTVWDGGGNDTYDLSNYGDGSTIDLRPGEWTTTSSTQLAGLGDGHTARGNIANALLFEGNTDSAIENAKGGSGADTLIANLVANHLTGNAGADIFKWMSTGDAGTGTAADTVLDFVRGTDKINFSNLDANPATGAHDAFSFIGTSAFHNVAGEVRYDVTGGNAHIFADVDGNGTADMEIILNNITVLAGTDFTF